MSLFLEARIYHNGMIVAKTQVPRHNIPPTLCFVDEVAQAEVWEQIHGHEPIDWTKPQPALHPKLPTLVASAIGIEVDSTGTWVRYFCSAEPR